MVLPVFLKKEMLFCSLKNEHLQELMHGKIISSPNKKIITNAIRQNKVIDEELQIKVRLLLVESLVIAIFYMIFLMCYAVIINY